MTVEPRSVVDSELGPFHICTTSVQEGGNGRVHKGRQERIRWVRLCTDVEGHMHENLPQLATAERFHRVIEATRINQPRNHGGTTVVLGPISRLEQT